MTNDAATELARQRFQEQQTRLAPVIRQHQVHFQSVALMGTAKHLRKTHGVDEPPSNSHALALLHMELHAAEAELGEQPAAVDMSVPESPDQARDASATHDAR